MGSETGKVKWFNEKRGFGFISCEGKPDVFVFLEGEEIKTLKEGQTVHFDVVAGVKGPKAANISVQEALPVP